MSSCSKRTSLLFSCSLLAFWGAAVVLAVAGIVASISLLFSGCSMPDDASYGVSADRRGEVTGQSAELSWHFD
jgi:hypothetical protein